MKDSSGKKLTAFTLLKPEDQYRTSLVYDDGLRIEHWGTYTVRFPKGKESVGDKPVQYSREQVNEIDAKVGKTKIVQQVFVNLAADQTLMAGALPEPGSVCKGCVEGEIEYNVRGWTPSDLRFNSPQAFDFTQIGEGYVRVSGPGVTGTLSRRYSRH